MKIVSEMGKPAYAKPGDAGFDLRAKLEAPTLLYPGEIRKIPTGLRVAIPEGFAGLVLPRSGNAARGLGIANSPGLVDSGYRGEIAVLAYNMTEDMLEIHPTDRIAQMMIVPYVQVDFEEVDDLDKTERGDGGFNSTGR